MEKGPVINCAANMTRRHSCVSRSSGSMRSMVCQNGAAMTEAISCSVSSFFQCR
jgi:hypothetical protein